MTIRIQSTQRCQAGKSVVHVDNCAVLYFDETQQSHPKPTKAQATQIDLALHLATHNYIRSLEKTIMQLPDAMRQKALSDFGHTYAPVPDHPSDELSPWSPVAQEPDCAPLLNQPSQTQQSTDEKKKIIEKCTAAIQKNSASKISQKPH
jgi:hypothetical protein